MRDTDPQAPPSAAALSSKESRYKSLVDEFSEEREVQFKNEIYLVRDNGAVLRRSRLGCRRRSLDDQWTFGSPNRQTGYLVLSDHVVHRIIATAFHGAPPSSEYVVDHIDTNRHNNRAENLRWVTRLDNILLNPITRRRIEIAFGSLEAFFANPGARTVSNWEWMRTVTKEEAAASLARLRSWAAAETPPTGGHLQEWVFEPLRRLTPSPEPDRIDFPSLTQGAIQRKWRTPTEFPQCPPEVGNGTLKEYLQRLKVGAVFAQNVYGSSLVAEAGVAADGALSVVCNVPSGIKDWSVARIFLEAGAVCHESRGTFFTKTGAMKTHLQALGVAFDEMAYQSIDDDA